MQPNQFSSINPATNALVAQYSGHSANECDQLINQAHSCFVEWRKSPFEQRSALMRRLAELLIERADEYGALITAEMGKPLAQARAEVQKCATVCEYYAANAEAFLADELLESAAQRSLAAFQPIGPVLAVMPWNFPLWQVFRFVAPALMAGNVGLLKHASNVQGCALAIEAVINDAGFPKGCFTNLAIGSAEVAAVIHHSKVAAVTLTGSTPAGKAVAAEAGAALKKSVLELGGSDPYIVLEDADLDLAADCCVNGRLFNAGQSCISPKRWIVVEAVQAAFAERVRSRLATVALSNPMEESTVVGPMAREDLRDELHQQVQSAVAHGARCALGGEVPKQAGAWYPVTLLEGVDENNPAFQQEFFGPVATLIVARDETHAIALANNSEFGLGSGVFTQDLARGEAVARQIDAGACVVNDFLKSDPRLPFGGIKGSGYGRELSQYGIREFVNIKTIVIA